METRKSEVYSDFVATDYNGWATLSLAHSLALAKRYPERFRSTVGEMIEKDLK